MLPPLLLLLCRIAAAVVKSNAAAATVNRRNDAVSWEVQTVSRGAAFHGHGSILSDVANRCLDWERLDLHFSVRQERLGKWF
jgi:hypothetical protein